MKKNVILFFLSSFFFLQLHAQKELWGVNSGPLNSDGYYGNIFRLNINGENPVLVHEFDGIHGFRPMGRLFQASNGKLYGTTKSGGNVYSSSGQVNNESCGVLFEYDLEINKYKVVHYFNIDPLFLVNTPIKPEIGVIEPIIGKLYGGTTANIYKYDFNTGVTTYFNEISTYFINGELMKASDGNLYTVGAKMICPYTNYPTLLNGSVLKFNMTNNNFSVAYGFNCDPFLDGLYPLGQLVEVSQGKLIGSAKSGGVYFTPQNNYFGSCLFEYNLNSFVFTKKYDLNQQTGYKPNGIINGGNGKFYGLCSAGGTTTQPCGTNTNTSFGTIYEYMPATNTLTVIKDFNNNPNCDFVAEYGTSLMRTSNGRFIGTMNGNSIFNYNITNDTITNEFGFFFPATNMANLIEMCRKPSYQEFLPNTYTPEQGTAFTFDVHNTNATTYVWKKGTTILTTQTTGILNLPSVTTSDTGVYTCTMTNECGTTVTMPLNINVTNLATETIDNYKEFISLYPNPTKGSISLKFPENRGLKAINYKVTNLLGQVVLQNDIAKNNTATSITIDTAGFANGIYQVTLATDKGNWNGRFVKE